MKIFSWMLGRRNEMEDRRKPNMASLYDKTTIQQPCKDEFSDWPNGLLAIGTFGNSNIKGTLPSSEDHPEDAAPEGFEEVDKDLKVLLNKCIVDFSGDSEKHIISDSLHEGEKKTYELTSNVSENSLVHSGAKDVRRNNKRSGIGKKSMSYLLKKVLLCKGGFVPSSSIKDILPDPKLDNSRMEKILRAMLHKKIYPQRPSPKTTSQKYLSMPETDSDEEDHEEEANPKSKWVKTDSEYIVLEI